MGNEIDAFLSKLSEGSGSTGVACANIGRRFIGIELEEKCFKLAKQRIEEAFQNQEER